MGNPTNAKAKAWTVVLVLLSMWMTVMLFSSFGQAEYIISPCWPRDRSELDRTTTWKDVRDCIEDNFDNLTKEALHWNLPRTAGLKPKCDGDGGYRSSDGSCNNRKIKESGMAGLEFANTYELLGFKPPKKPRYGVMDPNPRLVSTKLLRRDKLIKSRTNLNGIGMAQFAFLFHDLISHEITHREGQYKVEFRYDDPDWPCSRKKDEPHYMLVPKTKTVYNKEAKRNGFINHASAYFDGGMLYGNAEVTRELRTGSGGRIKLDKDGYMLVDYDRKNQFGWPYIYTGDQRAMMHQGLTACHTLWMREHNNVAELLEKEYPWLDDDDLFNKARLIVSTEIGIINAKEVLASLIDFMGSSLISIKIQDALDGKLKYDDEFLAFPEGLATVYRWHALVMDKLDIRDHRDGTLLTTVDYVDAGFDYEFLKKHTLENVIVGLASTPAGDLDLFNTPKKLLNFAPWFKTGAGKPNKTDDKDSCGAVSHYDIAMADIIRDRERGGPRYAEFRRMLGLDWPRRFEDITTDRKKLKALKEVYDNDVEKVDLLIGALAEDRFEEEGLPTTYLFFALPALSILLQKDRIAGEEVNQDTFTALGLARIRSISYAQVLKENTKIRKIAPRIFKTWGWFSVDNLPRGQEIPEYETEVADFALGYYVNSMIIAMVGFWVAARIIHFVMKRTFKVYRVDTFENQRAVDTYVIEIILTTLLAIWVAYLGVVLLMIQEISEETAQQLITAGLIVFSMYIFELIYRPSMRWQLIVHHLAVVVILMVTVYRFLKVEVFNLTIIQVVTVIGYTALSEQPIFVALLAYRLGDKRPFWFYFAAGWNAVTKLALHATALYFWGRAEGISLFWILFYVFIVICCLMPAQYYAIWVQYVIGRNLARKKSVSTKERLSMRRGDAEGDQPGKLKRLKTITNEDDLDPETRNWLRTKFLQSLEPTVENF